MPIPKGITKVNRRFLNPVMRHLAARMPGIAVVVHRGRKSGRRYEAPVLIFMQGERATLALTYGSDVDWLKNVMAAGGCRLIRRGREREATDPQRISTEEGMRRMPAPIRMILQLFNVDEFVEMTEAPAKAQADKTTA